MHLRSNPHNTRPLTKLNRKDNQQVRKPPIKRIAKQINFKAKIRETERNYVHRYMTRRRPKNLKRPHCISCGDVENDQSDVDQLYSEFNLKRLDPSADDGRRCYYQPISHEKPIDMNPRIHLRRCNFLRFLAGANKTPDINNTPPLFLFKPTLHLHRCVVREVLDHYVVEATKIKMFKVELYPMLTHTWVNPKDFTPQKLLFDEYEQRHSSVPGKILSGVRPVVQHPGRIVARRISPNGDVHVLWL